MDSPRQPGRGDRRYVCLALGVALVLALTMQAPPSQAREANDARPALRSLSKAFTQVAQDAIYARGGLHSGRKAP